MTYSGYNNICVIILAFIFLILARKKLKTPIKLTGVKQEASLNSAAYCEFPFLFRLKLPFAVSSIIPLVLPLRSWLKTKGRSFFFAHNFFDNSILMHLMNKPHHVFIVTWHEKRTVTLEICIRTSATNNLPSPCRGISSKLTLLVNRDSSSR